jgi:glycosyltransferase involved in cell wall biosynthesis
LALHDAAPAGIQSLSADMKIKERVSLFGKEFMDERFDKIAGYFGHLYPGRGVHIIHQLARRHPDIAFMIYGGNRDQICELKSADPVENFMLMGFVEPNGVIDVMRAMDILLMPYQENVSIGDKRSDTSRYMSPMKMFEYMACGVPIIASDLPSVREVLINEHNCLLATPNDVDCWSACITRLLDDDTLAQRIGHTAHIEYRSAHNWNSRAAKILNAVGGP